MKLSWKNIPPKHNVVKQKLFLGKSKETIQNKVWSLKFYFKFRISLTLFHYTLQGYKVNKCVFFSKFVKN